MNNNISPLLDTVRVDTAGQKKSSSSSNSQTGFSDSFREARREFDNRHDKGMSSERKASDDIRHSDKTPLKASQPEKADSASVKEGGYRKGDSLGGDALEGGSLEGGSEVAMKEDALEEAVNDTAVENTTKTTVADNAVATESGLLSINAESSVEDILTVLHEMIEQGDFQELESLFSPEEISALVELVDDGKSLPLNAMVISALETIKQSLNPVVPMVSANTAASSNHAPTLTPLDTVNPLADVVNSSATVEKPQAVSINQPNLKELTLDSSASLLSEAVTEAGLVEKALDGELESVGSLAKEEPKTVSSRLVAELLGPQATATNTPSLAKPQLSVATPFQQAQWGEAVSERVMWMSSKGIQEAEIHLDPPDLGPLQVKVSIVNEQAHVSFVVQHGSVREALDQSAMRLREMFEGEGIDLVDVDVSDQSEQFAEENREQSASAAVAEESDQIDSETVLKLSTDGYSLINTYV